MEALLENLIRGEAGQGIRKKYFDSRISFIEEQQELLEFLVKLGLTEYKNQLKFQTSIGSFNTSIIRYIELYEDFSKSIESGREALDKIDDDDKTNFTRSAIVNLILEKVEENLEFITRRLFDDMKDSEYKVKLSALMVKKACLSGNLSPVELAKAISEFDENGDHDEEVAKLPDSLIKVITGEDKPTTQISSETVKEDLSGDLSEDLSEDMAYPDNSFMKTMIGNDKWLERPPIPSSYQESDEPRLWPAKDPINPRPTGHLGPAEPLGPTGHLGPESDEPDDSYTIETIEETDSESNKVPSTFIYRADIYPSPTEEDACVINEEAIKRAHMSDKINVHIRPKVPKCDDEERENQDHLESLISNLRNDVELLNID